MKEDLKSRLQASWGATEARNRVREHLQAARAATGRTLLALTNADVHAFSKRKRARVAGAIDLGFVSRSRYFHSKHGKPATR